LGGVKALQKALGYRDADITNQRRRVFVRVLTKGGLRGKVRKTGEGNDRIERKKKGVSVHSCE